MQDYLFSIGLSLAVLTRICLIGLLFLFARWSYQHKPLIAIYWIFSYLVLRFGIGFIASKYPVDVNSLLYHMNSSSSVSIGQIQASMQYGSVIINNLSLLIIALLVMSDIVHLVGRNEAQSWLYNQLQSIRLHHTAWGIILLFMAVLYPIAMVALSIYLDQSSALS